MIGLLDAAKIAGGMALGAMIATPAAHYLGKREGRQEAAVAALEQSVKVLRERSATDDEISRSDLAGLCRHLGLLPDDESECVRRLAEAQHATGDGALRDDE